MAVACYRSIAVAGDGERYVYDRFGNEVPLAGTLICRAVSKFPPTGTRDCVSDPWLPKATHDE